MLAAVASATVPLQFGGGGLLWWALIFLVLAILAGFAGFNGVAGLSMGAAKLLVGVFLVLLLASLLLNFL